MCLLWLTEITPVSASLTLPGLSARLDKLVYHHGGQGVPPDQPHAFIYFITIHNGTEHTINLLGRKWVIAPGDGTRKVIEGEGIVGENPVLSPGESFSYNSYHVSGGNASVQGSFHGIDETGRAIHVILPPFVMCVPTGTE